MRMSKQVLDGGNQVQCPKSLCALPVESDVPHLSDVIDEELSRNGKCPASQKALLKLIVIGANQYLHMDAIA